MLSHYPRRPIQDWVFPSLVADVKSCQIHRLLESASLRQAIALFRQRGISGAPVLSVTHRLIGIITMTDILTHVFSAEAVKRVVDANADMRLQRSLHLLEAPVRNYMTREVVTVAPDASIQEACAC